MRNLDPFLESFPPEWLSRLIDSNNDCGTMKTINTNTTFYGVKGIDPLDTSGWWKFYVMGVLLCVCILKEQSDLKNLKKEQFNFSLKTELAKE